ncbi:MAG: NAD(P)/FAD-dependent oxidoreductase [Bacteroidota bacterium]
MPKLIELALAPEKAADPAAWHAEAIRLSGIPGNEIRSVNLRKRSIDARSKHVLVRMQVEIRTISDGSDNKSEILSLQQVQDAPSVVIAGCGPSGMFAALRLIACGIKPIIVERGKPVRERRRDLAQLNRERVVNPDSNYCFGEGGAGTYSDGKLYTRSGKRGDINRILETFIQFGASPDIAIDAHPHIGTNKLPAIIAEMNKTIVACGGEILFNNRVAGMVHDSTGVRKVTVQSTSANQEPYDISCSGLILATGHSSRDVFEMLHQNRIAIEAKPFALGVRIEHPQHEIDRIRYHCDSRGAYLPPASYALVEQAVGRGVYSFCMCPGGIIAAAATGPGELVVNGWSPSKRNNPYANSGLVVEVKEADFKPYQNDGALRALRFQQSVERKAFESGGSDLTAPAQRLMDFLEFRNSSTLPDCSYTPGIKPVRMDDVLPSGIISSIREGLKMAGKKMKGYLTNEAVLVATESRTSSPVRIPRDADTLMHPQVNGLFPCGEGAGYAGGIMSAAMDGERVAEKCASWIHHSKRN